MQNFDHEQTTKSRDRIYFDLITHGLPSILSETVLFAAISGECSS